MKRTSLPNLVQVTRDYGEAVASSWSAHLSSTEDVVVWHYATMMFRVHPDNTVTPISRGWGSQTDKTGTGKILSKVNGQRYAQVFAGF